MSASEFLRLRASERAATWSGASNRVEERELTPRYIEACRESECIQVLQPHVAEIWRLTYVTPPPTSPRTFVVLLLSRELVSAPHGERCFMNSECDNAERSEVWGAVLPPCDLVDWTCVDG